jgi:hypothetical protein
MFYVWNGRGARPEEKKTAFDYASNLCGDVEGVFVLNEGENDEDEMFWAVLGDGDREYAKASHWAWRAGLKTGDPQLWKITTLPGHQVGTAICRVPETRLMHRSSRILSSALTRRLRVMSSSWTLYGRYSSSLVLRLGASGMISGWPLQLQR